MTTHRPARGSIITIEPFRTLEEIARVKAAINRTSGPGSDTAARDLALFTMGVNTNLRASDLLALRADQVDWLSGKLTLREGKTKKIRVIPLNPALMALLVPLIPEDPAGLLFPSSKGGGQMAISTFNHLVKLWALRAGLQGSYGTRSLRKSWATIQHTIFKTPLELLSQEMNHSNMNVTYRYLGILPSDVEKVYSNFI